MTLAKFLPRALLLLAFVSATAVAQTYPNRVVKFIVPFAPGGQSDAVARIVGQKLAERWASRSSSRTSRAPRRRSAPTSSRNRRPTATRSCSRPRRS